jgi:hypothetical protein
MSAYQNKYMQPRRLAFIRIFEKARAQGLLPQNTDVEILADMITGTMLYYLLFQPDERNEAKVRVYLLRLFQQAGFRIPATWITRDPANLTQVSPSSGPATRAARNPETAPMPSDHLGPK